MALLPPDQKNLALDINPKLLEDCTKGSRKAQYALYKHCFPILVGVCRRYRREEDEVMAMMNEGFLKILDNLAKYRRDVPFDAWIRRVMINVLIDDFRKNKHIRELVEHTDFSEVQFAEDAFDMNEADKQFDVEQLESFILELPPVSRKVFNLFAIDGYSHREIGDMLNISEGTSKWHLSFSRKKLIEIMQRSLNSSRVV